MLNGRSTRSDRGEPNQAQALIKPEHTGILLVRDDGVERGVGTTIFADDRGHTLRVLLLGAYGPGATGPGQCLLGAIGGAANRAAVQAERLLVILAVK